MAERLEQQDGTAGAPPMLVARLHTLLSAAVKMAEADWALVALESAGGPVAGSGIDIRSANARSIAAAALDPLKAKARGAGFVCAIPGTASDTIGVLVVGGGRRRIPKHIREALGELCTLASYGISLETERVEREGDRSALSAELDHRVKNVLAAVQALATQTAKRAGSLDGFLKSFSGRLKTLASAHELLTATRWRGARLHDVAAAELSGLAPGQIRWEGPDLFLTPKASNALSLALHELAINAAKYGALSNTAGKVAVRWKTSAGGGFCLEWSESGGPPPPANPQRGFGRTLLEDITGRELYGQVRFDFTKSGVRAVIEAGSEALAQDEAPQRQVREPEQVSEGPPPPAPAGAVKGLRVLVVEDAVLLGWELKAGLTEAGAKVVGPAADLTSAIEMLAQPIDAAVLDCNLNGLSVRPVAEALAAKGLPFLFATGYGENQGAPEGFDAPIVRKPYDITQILTVLASLVRNRT
ncbi:MAG: HWE histidine kinase domain-containing protein [Caulobacteraceae bacterium]